MDKNMKYAISFQNLQGMELLKELQKRKKRKKVIKTKREIMMEKYRNQRHQMFYFD